jgi:hypothetical protein
VARAFDRADITNIVGAPSLRFVQGRVRCCQYRGVYRARRSASHVQYALSALKVERTSDEDCASESGRAKASLQASVVPALAQNARAGHPFVVDTSKTKRLGYPPTDELKSVRYIGVRTDVSVDDLLCR